MKVRIDEAACEGHGRCFAIAPALFELDELGTSSLIGDGSVSPADEELVRLAAANCPEFAIGISGGVTGARSPRPSISATTSNRISHPRFAQGNHDCIRDATHHPRAVPPPGPTAGGEVDERPRQRP